MVIHGLLQITQEIASNARQCAEGDCYDVHSSYPIRKCLLQGHDTCADNSRSDSWDFRKRCSIVGGKGFDKSHNRAFGESSAYSCCSDVAGDVLGETGVKGGSVDGGEDGRGHRSGARRDGSRCGDEMMRRGELDSSNDKDKRSTESDPSQTGKDDRTGRIVGLDRGKADDAGSKEQESYKQRRPDCPQLGARIAVENRAQTASHPKRLAPSNLQKRICLEEGCSPV